MTFGDIWQQPAAAAGLAALLGGIHLWQRFNERRPFSTAPTLLLFVLICLVSAGVAAGLAAVGRKVGLLYAGVAYAFTTPSPNGGEIKGSDGSVNRGVLAQLATGLLALTGSLTNILDRRLSAAKLSSCRRLVQLVERTYTDDYEFYERLHEFLKRWVENLTDRRQQAVCYARLRSAYAGANKSNGTERYLLELVYDWKLEKLLQLVIESPPSRKQPRVAPRDLPPAVSFRE